MSLYIKKESGEFVQIPFIKGEKGEKGEDGITPHIGNNGNWFVGDTDSGKLSRGEDGGYYTPKVSFPGTNAVQFDFEPSVDGMLPVPSETITIPAGKNGVGIKSVVLNSDYTLTIRYDDDTSYTSESIRGEKGEQGDTGDTGPQGPKGDTGSNGVSVTHEWDGTVLKITSASGTSSANLKGEKGEKGEQGIQGIPGEKGDTGAAGTSVTVKSVSESTADGGSNVVTFSDGKTLTVKNGSKGSDGESVTVPQAVVDGASAVVNRALSRGAESVLRFIAFSDAHQKNDDVNITAGNKELGMAIGEIVNRIGVDFASNLGDSGWSAYANTTEEVREQIKTLNTFIQPYIKGEQQLNVEGNHDDSVYSIIDNDGDGTTSSTEKFSLAETYALIWAKNRDVVYDPDHAIDGYCYKDFGHIKTRVICLNTEQGTGDGGIIEGYQLKWFAETALNMDAKADWNVVTLAHHPLDWGHGSLFKDCVNIVDAFINGSNFSYTTTDGTAIAVDYSNKNCQYVGHFHGHTHAFSIVRMTKYVNDSYVDMNAWQIGIPNACYARNNHNLGNASERIARFSTPTTYDKSNVDGQRTSFNLVSVDLDNKIIYADNYGAGIDRQVAFTFAETVYTITNALTNCTSGNSAASIEENASYFATITPDDGYEMSSITVTMGGTDVTASAVNGRTISIGNVTGNIVITAVAEAISDTPTYINQIPISTDTDDSVYNGKGFKENTRIETSGATGTKSGIGATGFIPIGAGSANTARGEQVIYMANIDAALDANTRIAFYKSDKKTFIGLEYAKNLKDAAADPGGMASLYTLGDDGFINKMDFTGLTSYYKNSGKGETAFFRIGAPGLDGDSIITVNEPIE